MNKENRNMNVAKENSEKGSPESKPPVPCKFEELKDDFLIQREIGRGSYGVVFKAIRNEKKMNGLPLNSHGDTAMSHNKYVHGKNYKYAENTSDMDENGNIKKYAVKRIFPTINAAFILIEMLILKYLNGENNVTELIQGYRLEGQVSLVFRYQKSQPFLTYLNDMDLAEIKNYMFCMLKAVEHLANNGIMHRDIKPSNFLYDKNAKSGLLIDFGLSELELNSQGKPVKNEDNETVKKIS